MASRETLAERLLALEARMDRLERLSFLTYTEMRKVAEYAYLNVRLEATADSVKRVPSMRALDDRDAFRSGMTLDDVVALKLKMRFLSKRCREDVLGIAKELADERFRYPVSGEEEEEEREVA